MPRGPPRIPQRIPYNSRTWREERNELTYERAGVAADRPGRRRLAAAVACRARRAAVPGRSPQAGKLSDALQGAGRCRARDALSERVAHQREPRQEVVR